VAVDNDDIDEKRLDCRHRKVQKPEASELYKKKAESQNVALTFWAFLKRKGRHKTTYNVTTSIYNTKKGHRVRGTIV
jgi:hypothetical protein